MRVRRPGMSLLEVIVGSVLGLLVMSAVFYAFYSSVRLSQWVGVRTDVTSAAMLGLNNLSRELRSSCYQATTIVPGPVSAGGIVAGPVISFQVETTDLATSMSLEFQSCMSDTPGATTQVVYYFDQTHQTLVRKAWPPYPSAVQSPTPPPSGVRLPAPQVQAIVGLVNGSEHVVASHIVGMTTTPATLPLVWTVSSPPPTAVQGICVTLDVKETPPHQGPEEAAVQTTIYPRNHP